MNITIKCNNLLVYKVVLFNLKLQQLEAIC